MPRKYQSEDSILRKIAVSADHGRAELGNPSVSASAMTRRSSNPSAVTKRFLLRLVSGRNTLLREKHRRCRWLEVPRRAISDVARWRHSALLLAQSGSGGIAYWPMAGLFLGGLGALRESSVCTGGGDTTRRNEILINVTVVGEVRAGRATGDRVLDPATSFMSAVAWAKRSWDSGSSDGITS